MNLRVAYYTSATHSRRSQVTNEVLTRALRGTAPDLHWFGLSDNETEIVKATLAKNKIPQNKVRVIWRMTREELVDHSSDRDDRGRTMGGLQILSHDDAFTIYIFHNKS